MAVVGSRLRSLTSIAADRWLGHPDDLEGKVKQTLNFQSEKWIRKVVIFDNKIFCMYIRL